MLILVQMLNSRSIEAGGAADDTVDNVAFGEEEFR